MKLEKLLAAAGSAVAVAALLWYLLRENDALEGVEVAGATGEGDEDKKKQQAKKQGPMTRDALLEILREWDMQQKKVKTSIKAVASAVNSEKLSFEQTYERVKDAMPEDPLAARGLSFGDLEGPLQMCQAQGDVEVLQLFQSVMGGPNGADLQSASAKSKTMTVDKITEINNFMVEELEKIIAHYKGLPNSAAFDKQAVGHVSRVMLDARIEEKYGLQQEDMESAMQRLMPQLQGNRAFVTTFTRMQQAMEAL